MLAGLEEDRSLNDDWLYVLYRCWNYRLKIRDQLGSKARSRMLDFVVNREIRALMSKPLTRPLHYVGWGFSKIAYYKYQM